MGLELAKAFVRIRADASRLKGDLGKVRTIAVSAVGGMARKMAKLFNPMVVAAAGIAAAIGTIAVALKGLQLVAALEQTTISFQTMLGSADKAKKLIEDLTEFAAKTPFEMKGVLSATKILLAFGLESEALMPTLKALGDISAGTGKDFAELAAIFGKTMAGGKLQGDEMNQLVEAGIPIVAELAKVFDVNTSAIKKMVSEGKVGFADVAKAMENMTGEGGIFNNLMAKQSASLGGLWSTFKDGVLEALRRIMTATAPFTKRVLDMGIRVVDAFSKLMDETGSFWNAFTSLAAIAFRFVAETSRNVFNAMPELMGFALNKMLLMFAQFAAKLAPMMKELVDGIGESIALLPDMLRAAMGGKVSPELLKATIQSMHKQAFAGKAPDFSAIFAPSDKVKSELAAILGDLGGGLNVEGRVGGLAAGKGGAEAAAVKITKTLGDLEDQLRGLENAFFAINVAARDFARQPFVIPAQVAEFRRLQGMIEDVEFAKEMKERGEALKESLLTPVEELRRSLTEIESLMAGKDISFETARRAVEGVLPEKEKPRFADFPQAGRLIQEALFRGKKDKQAEMVEQQKRGNKILVDIVDAIEEQENGLVPGNN